MDRILAKPDLAGLGKKLPKKSRTTWSQSELAPSKHREIVIPFIKICSYIDMTISSKDKCARENPATMSEELS